MAQPSERTTRKQDTQQPSRTELAEDRTEWAHRRTLLAKERTFAAWVRTGLAAIAVGFAVAQLLRDFEPQWLVMIISGVLVLTGMIVLALGYLSYRKTFRELLQEGVRGLPVWIIGGITLLLILSGVAGLILLLLNR